MIKVKERIDIALVDRGLAPSREKAKALIMSGIVYLNEEKVTKASQTVEEGEVLSVRGKTLRYVSRGGLKLEKALQVFPVDPEGRTVMDVGASTGGFTDCLLQNGAKHVFAIDVGYGQLDWRLRQDARVTVMERCNARALTPDQLDGVPTLAVMDVSFISVRLIFPALVACLPEDGEVISLIKPQFEAGREKVGKKGVVRDPEVHIEVIETVLAAARECGLYVRGLSFSPITGPEGNIEFLMYASKDPAGEVMPDRAHIEETVRAAHGALNGKNGQ